MSQEEREKIIQALANLDDVTSAIGTDLMELAGCLKPMAKAYELLNSVVGR